MTTPNADRPGRDLRRRQAVEHFVASVRTAKPDMSALVLLYPALEGGDGGWEIDTKPSVDGIERFSLAATAEIGEPGAIIEAAALRDVLCDAFGLTFDSGRPIEILALFVGAASGGTAEADRGAAIARLRVRRAPGLAGRGLVVLEDPRQPSALGVLGSKSKGAIARAVTDAGDLFNPVDDPAVLYWHLDTTGLVQPDGDSLYAPFAVAFAAAACSVELPAGFKVAATGTPGAEPGGIGTVDGLDAKLVEAWKKEARWALVPVGQSGISPPAGLHVEAVADVAAALKVGAGLAGRLLTSATTGLVDDKRYIDRVELLDHMREDLLHAPGAVVVVHGMAGAGKTVAARKVIEHYDVKQRFVDGVIWIDWDEVGSNAVLLSKVAGALGVVTDATTQAGQIRQKLGAGHYLVVVDNLPDPPEGRVIPNCGDRPIPDGTIDTLARELFGSAVGGSGLLCTSRVVLSRPSGPIRQRPVELLSAAEAWQLFDRIVPEIRDADIPVFNRAKELIERLGGHALTVAIVSCYCAAENRRGQTLSLSDAIRTMHAKIDARDPKDNLYSGEVAAYEHYWWLSEVFEAAIGALRPDDQERYRRLAVFDRMGAIPLSTLSMAWEVTNDELERLVAEIVRRSLANRGGGPKKETISAHDLQLGYLKYQAGALDHLADWHGQLIDRYCGGAGRAKPYWSVEPDGHYYEHLCDHLVRADEKNVAANLLFDTEFLKASLGAVQTARTASHFDIVINAMEASR